MVHPRDSTKERLGRRALIGQTSVWVGRGDDGSGAPTAGVGRVARHLCGRKTPLFHLPVVRARGYYLSVHVLRSTWHACPTVVSGVDRFAPLTDGAWDLV